MDLLVDTEEGGCEVEGGQGEGGGGGGGGAGCLALVSVDWR